MPVALSHISLGKRRERGSPGHPQQPRILEPGAGERDDPVGGERAGLQQVPQSDDFLCVDLPDAAILRDRVQVLDVGAWQPGGVDAGKARHAHAATLEGDKAVTQAHLQEVAHLALGHRLRRNPPMLLAADHLKKNILHR